MIVVKAKLPSMAYNHIPKSTKYQIISKHRNTSIGIKHAHSSAVRTNNEYTRTHGNGASRRIRIFVDGKKLTIQQFEYEYYYGVI